MLDYMPHKLKDVLGRSIIGGAVRHYPHMKSKRSDLPKYALEMGPVKEIDIKRRIFGF
jgi:hypothetical protein